MIYQLTVRIPVLMQQSHLESTEGRFFCHAFNIVLMKGVQHGRLTGLLSSEHLPHSVRTHAEKSGIRRLLHSATHSFPMG